MNMVWVGAPCASTPCDIAIRPSPAVCTSTMTLRGGGPGLYVDFARLSFQTPIMGSGCAKPVSGTAAAKKNAISATTSTRIKTANAVRFISAPLDSEHLEALLLSLLTTQPKAQRAARKLA